MLVGAGALLGEAAQSRGIVLLEVDQIDEHQTVGQSQGRLDGVGQTPAHALAHDKTVDDDLDVVLEPLVELGDLAEPMRPPVHAHA